MGQRQSIEDEDVVPLAIPDASHANTDSSVGKRSRLLDLPSELLDQILGYLSPVALTRVCKTCKILNTHGSLERLWKSLLVDCTPCNNYSHKPFASWKEMYSTHYPYWFLPQHKIWFSDKTCLSNPLIGQVILARYDHRIGSVEGYRLVAEHAGLDTSFPWTHGTEETNVLIHNFEPRVGLYIDDPVIKLDRGAFKPGYNRLQQEVMLTRVVSRDNNFLSSQIFPTIPIPTKYQASSMALWPPNTIPSTDRVRIESSSHFRDTSHKPTTYEQMSTTSFRLRKCFALNPGFRTRFGLRVPEDVMTYSTISPEYYTPTTEKPYQGIWVGDYPIHGCEFLLIIQSTPDEARDLEPVEENPPHSKVPDIKPHLPPSSTPNPPGHTGRLDAIKLTGDPHVPRGQPTWIAQDISRTGLIRIAQEPEFRGARVVKSSGHIASPGFRNDSYTPCQLIMINENTLAQYWIDIQLILFYKRVNIDDYLRISK